jgi:hypothetical protein
MDTTPFLIEGKKIEWVDSFEYLGRILSADDTDDIAIYSQLEKTKKVKLATQIHTYIDTKNTFLSNS